MNTVTEGSVTNGFIYFNVIRNSLKFWIYNVYYMDLVSLLVVASIPKYKLK